MTEAQASDQVAATRSAWRRARRPLGRRLPPNEDVAHVLERVADLLDVQGANRYRVRAYRHAAQSVRDSASPVAELAVTEPPSTLERLPGIGASIGSAIREYAASGHLRMLERLEGQVSPEDLFASVPGIGEELARRIHTQLGLETLEELELSAHNGQLEWVPGVGPRRARALREILDGLLSRSARRRARLVGVRHTDTARPSVDLLLQVDAEYRQKAEARQLRTITPRRFNPARLAWLPIFHTEVGGWLLTALFSNTARAHELGTTQDWVIVYYERDGDEGQSTVVTERHGPTAGRRVVRGREAECLVYHHLS
jgi:DNA uptake protein ComE-like DNA-binding protein